MAVLNNIEKTERKRELTEKQQSFLKHYLETMKDAGKNLSELELLNELDNVYKMFS